MVGVAIPVLGSVDAFVHWADGVMINREAKMAFDAVVVVTYVLDDLDVSEQASFWIGKAKEGRNVR